MLTDQLIRQYFVEESKLPKHRFYDRSVEITKKLESHSKGKYPSDIIEIVRPNETFDQKQYRKNAFTPVTKTYFSKVVSTIAKISHAQDWSIRFPEDSTTKEGESLKDYTCENYPNFDSLENWFFTLQLREMCDDPNGVIAVFPYPKKDDGDDSEFLKPFTFWFESKDVIDFVEGQYAVLRSQTKSKVTVKGAPQNTGLIYYIFDSDSYTIATQVGEKDKYTFSYEIKNHLVGTLPCFKIGGIIEEFEEGQILYDSFIGDCLPFWDEALRRYSDLQVQMVLHVHSEKWEIEDTPCKTCSGTGQIRSSYMGNGNHQVTCGTCNGLGNVSTRSLFGVKTVKPASKTGVSDSMAIPTPPMGYIAKPIDETKFIHDQVQENIEAGLAAINMEFLMYEPAVNSGVAKSLDRQEMNAFFSMIARHVVNNVFHPCYYLIAKWRYAAIYSEKDIMDSLPEIKVPTDFDVLTQDIIAQRLASAKQAGLSSGLMSQLELQYAEKEFGETSDQVLMLKAISSHDPLPNLTVDEKMTILSNKGCSNEDYILSAKLPYFVNKAVNKEKEFLQMTYDEQEGILNKYVAIEIAKNTSSLVPIVNNNGDPGGGQQTPNR
jgi:hypothetical protein